MRKIVCNKCAADWGIQHCCPGDQFQSARHPTCIWEPDEPPMKIHRLCRIIRELEAELVKTKRDHSDMEAWGKEQLQYATKLQAQNAKLRAALEFYAKGEHLESFEEWDTVSGEPENWIFPEWEGSDDRPEGVEIGQLAKAALEDG